MEKRTYHRYCPIAYALDVVGDRWTFLIVGELFFGGRRFTDLLSGLPGISRNLLSQRLKDLEKAGIVWRKKLPPPAATMVYELTERGLGLEGVFEALGRWGLHSFPVSAPQGDVCTIVSLLHALKNLFQAEAARALTLTGEIHTGDEVFYAAVSEGTLDLKLGFATDPDVVIAIDTTHFGELLMQQLSLEAALTDKLLQITTGSPEQLKTLLGLFPLPQPA